MGFITGIRDENDQRYNPKVVRIGLKPHHSVQAVSMDYLVSVWQSLIYKLLIVTLYNLLLEIQKSTRARTF